MTSGRHSQIKPNKPIVPLKSKLKKDPGIPRLPDLKVRNADKGKGRSRALHHKSDQDAIMASEPTFSSLALLATSSQDDLSSPQIPDDPSSSLGGKAMEQVRKHYLRTLHKVIDQSDIIILVLDARDPEGCRSRLVEEEVRRRETEGKKLIFVLNKIDLIPRSNAQSWLKYLRHTTPTLPFLSSSASQHQRNNISSITAPALLKLLKAYKPKAGSVTVGVVGFPNVGKSSLINSMKRSKVCAVAAQPGHTKELQSVQLERGIRIVDSPGVVFDDDEDMHWKGKQKGSVLLRNVVKVEDVEDPIAVVEEILGRTALPAIQKIYNLPEFTSTLEFLTMFALSGGRLLKGGTPDILSAARQVLTDWNHQKIPYFSEPPAIHPSLIPSIIPGNLPSALTPIIAPGAETVGQAQILTELSKPFELAGLFSSADAGAFEGGDDIEMGSEGEGEDIFWDAEEGMENDGIQMESDDPAPRLPMKRSRSQSPVPSIAPAQQREKRQRKAKNIPAYDAPPEEHALRGMERSNPLSRKVLKREAKRARRAGRTRAVVEAGAVGMEVDDDVGLQFTFMV